MTVVMDETKTNLTTDAELLSRWTRDKDPAAFGELVRRHVDLVYAAAARQLRSQSHLADDVTQAVFLVLARRANSIHRAELLPAWLHRTTRYAAANAVRGEARRRKYEQSAAAERGEQLMPTETTENDALLPILDQAISQLNAKDQATIIGRFLKGQDFSSLAATLGTTTAAAQKRTERAVQKLRSIFQSRGIVVPAAMIGVTLTQAAAHAAPPHVLAASIKTGSAASAASTTFAGQLAGKTAVSLAKTKLVAGLLTAATVIAVGGGVVILEKSKPARTPAVQSSLVPSALPIAAVPPVALATQQSSVAQLKNGVTSEIISLGEQATGQWWKPDGTPTQPPIKPQDWVKQDITNPKPGMRYVYMVSYTSVAPGGSSSSSIVPDSLNAPAGVGVYENGKSYQVHIIEVDPSQGSTSWRSQFASTPIVPVLISAQGGAWDMLAENSQVVEGVDTFAVSQPREVSGKATFDLQVPPKLPPNYTYQIEVNMADSTRGSSYSYPGTADGKMPLTVEAPLAAVRSAGVSITHYDQYADFRGISLYPNIKTNYETVVGDLTAEVPTQQQVQDMVRKVRADEVWVDHVSSLQLKLQSTATKGAMQMAFDQSRLYLHLSSPDNKGYQGMTEFWDGSRRVQREIYDGKEQVSSGTNREQISRYFMANLNWLRCGPHRFWWSNNDEPGEDFFGRPEDFTYKYRTIFDGVDCYVLDCAVYNWRFYIGVRDGRLYGIDDNVFANSSSAKRTPLLKNVAKNMGKTVANDRQYNDWYAHLSAEQRHQADVIYFRELRAFAVLRGTYHYSDWKEVAPGKWLPTTVGYVQHPFEQAQTPNGMVLPGQKNVAYKITESEVVKSSQVIDVQINQPLPDELFK